MGDITYLIWFSKLIKDNLKLVPTFQKKVLIRTMGEFVIFIRNIVLKKGSYSYAAPPCSVLFIVIVTNI